MSTKIQFSQKALEKNNRNSSNYVLSSVKSRWTWLLLTALTFFFGAMIFWGFYGSMVVSVPGIGITMLSKGSRPVLAGGNGMISHLNIQSGSAVREGQVLGQIYDAETFFNIQRLSAEYAQLKSQIDTLSRGVDELSQKKQELALKKKQYLDYLSNEYDKGKDRTTEVAEMYRKLKGIDAVSTVTYYQSLDQRLQTESSMISIVLQNIAAEVENETALWDSEQRLITLQQQLDAKKHELDLADQLYHDAFWIRAEFSGTIREMLVEGGSFIHKGEKIAIIDSNESGIYLVAFVAAEQGKKIKNGMSAYFAPSSIPANDFGYLRCIVREVSSQPNTPESIQAELMNSSLTQMIAGKSAMVRVVLELIPDKDSFSKYSWTSSKGAPSEITSGMLGQLTINTQYRAPASYIIPAVREFFHGDSIKSKAEE